jgi:hypothetical protein
MSRFFNSPFNIILFVIGVVLLIFAALSFITIMYITHYKNPADKKLSDAGIVEKNAQVGEVHFNYAEGPDHGPPLLLLHAQLLD